MEIISSFSNPLKRVAVRFCLFIELIISAAFSSAIACLVSSLEIMGSLYSTCFSFSNLLLSI